MTTPLQFHEVSNLLPDMDSGEFLELVADIRTHGLREPIWLYEGKIIDGRHRYRACRQLNIEPKTREWEGKGSLVAFVVSLNLRRRHLTATQRALLGKQIKPKLAEEARLRMLRGKESDPRENFREGKAAEQAAQLVGVSDRMIEHLEHVERHAPDVYPLVESERIKPDVGRQLSDLPPEVRAPIIETAIAEPEKPLRRLVLDAHKAERLKARHEDAMRRAEVQATAQEIVNNVEGLAEVYERYARKEELAQTHATLNKCLRLLDPAEYIGLLDGPERSLLECDLSDIRRWVDQAENLLHGPLRVLAGGRDAG